MSLRYAQRPTLSALWELAQTFRREWWQSDPEFRPLTAVRSSLPVLIKSGLEDYFEALIERDRLIACFDEAIAGYDALLLPVAMTTAIAHCPAGSAITINNKAMPYWLANGAYLQPFNLLGNPVVVIPVGKDGSGMPIGLQIIGQRWREMELLAVAAAIDGEIGPLRLPESMVQPIEH